MATPLAEAAFTLRADGRRLRRGLGGMLGSIRGFAGKASRLINPLSAGLAVLGAGAGVGALVGKSLSVAAAFEQTRVAFGVMLGDVVAGDKLIASLRGFSDVTPFEPAEITDAGKKLLAFGVSADQVVPSLNALGDVAAGLQIPIGELSELYGKARTQGRLMQEDINQLAGRGVPIYAELAKIFGVAESEVRDLVSAGKIGFPQLQKVFANLSGEGGQFFGLMAKQSATTGGLFSTLRGRVTTALEGIGKALIEGLGINDLLGKLNSNLGRTTGKIVSGIQFVIGKFRSGLSFVRGIFAEYGREIRLWGQTTAANFVMLGGIAKTIFGGVVSAVTWLGDKLGLNASIFEGWRDKVTLALLISKTAFENWRKVVEINFLRAWKAGVDLRDGFTHVFTAAIPNAMRAMVQESKTAFMDLRTVTLGIMANMFSNIANLYVKGRRVVTSFGLRGKADLGVAIAQAINPSNVTGPIQAALNRSKNRTRGIFARFLLDAFNAPQSEIAKSLEDRIGSLTDELGDAFKKNVRGFFARGQREARRQSGAEDPQGFGEFEIDDAAGEDATDAAGGFFSKIRDLFGESNGLGTAGGGKDRAGESVSLSEQFNRVQRAALEQNDSDAKLLRAVEGIVAGLRTNNVTGKEVLDRINEMTLTPGGYTV